MGELQFGNIEFEGAASTLSQYEVPKFVKVDSNTDVKNFIDAIKKEWNLDHPNLLISIMGGAWDFPINATVNEIFFRGIGKATVGTKAWLLTSGTNVGVAKYSAEAIWNFRLVTDEIIDQEDTGEVVTIGISSWNSLHTAQRFELETALETGSSAKIVVPSSDAERVAVDRMLDPNHSRFILVDDTTIGSSLKFAQGAKVTLNFRTKLEKALSTYMVEASESDFADVIHAIQEVEPTDLQKLFNGLSLEYDDIQKNEDGAFTNDAISKALEVFRKWKNDNNQKATRSSLLRGLKKCNTEAQKKIEEKWKDSQVPVVCMYIEGGRACIHHAIISVENDIPIVVIDNSGRASSFLAAAYRSDGLKQDKNNLKVKLRKIIKVDDDETLEKIETSLKEKRHLWNISDACSEIGMVILEALMNAYSEDANRQLSLAQTWNRVDIITNELFTSMIENVEWDDYNAEAKYFEERLHTGLVNDQPGFVKLFLDNGVINLNTFLTRTELQCLYNEVEGSALERIMKKNPGESKELKEVGMTIRSLTTRRFLPYQECQTVNKNYEKSSSDNNETLDDPFWHLFLFAVLNNFHELAEYFWEEGKEHMAAALTAASIYKNMASRLNGENSELIEKARKYENLACEILDECEKELVKDGLHDLLIRELSNWGYVTCLKLAETASCKLFLAHPAVQYLIEYIWAKGPPGSQSILQSKTLTERLRGEKVAPNEHVHHNGNSKVRQQPNHFMAEVKRKKRSSTKSVSRFFAAPKAKFMYNMISYVLFLVLYSYVMLSNQLSSPTLTWSVVLLLAWCSTLIVEEIRQFWHDVSIGRWKEYFTDYWNVIDITMLGIFIVASVLAIITSTREIAAILFATDLFLFYFRFLHVLTIHPALGPKVIMIFKMFYDLMLFLAILFIILLGYGIALQSVLYTQTLQLDDFGSVVKSIFYRPYFQMYGELFLEEITATASDGTCSDDQADIDLGVPPCPHNSDVGLVFLALYMLLSNVLLLNLLIAMFSDTYSKIQEETDILWKFQFYDLTREYFQRPLLMPPFIFMAHIYRSTRWILREINLLDWKPSKMKYKFDAAKTGKLIKLEKQVAYNYIIDKRRSQNNALCRCFHHTESSKKRILDRLNEFDEMPLKNSTSID